MLSFRDENLNEELTQSHTETGHGSFLLPNVPKVRLSLSLSRARERRRISSEGVATFDVTTYLIAAGGVLQFSLRTEIQGSSSKDEIRERNDDVGVQIQRRRARVRGLPIHARSLHRYVFLVSLSSLDREQID